MNQMTSTAATAATVPPFLFLWRSSSSAVLSVVTRAQNQSPMHGDQTVCRALFRPLEDSSKAGKWNSSLSRSCSRTDGSIDQWNRVKTGNQIMRKKQRCGGREGRQKGRPTVTARLQVTDVAGDDDDGDGEAIEVAVVRRQN